MLRWLAQHMQVATGKSKVTQANSRIRPATDMAEDTGVEPRLSDDSQAFIGLRLRELYDDVVAEPVPDRLLRLLDQLGEDEKQPE